jgi:hypothetical protein
VINKANKKEKEFIRTKFELLFGRARFYQMWDYRPEIKQLGLGNELIKICRIEFME